MVRTPCLHGHGAGLIPDWGTKILQAARHCQENKRKQNIFSYPHDNSVRELLLPLFYRWGRWRGYMICPKTLRVTESVFELASVWLQRLQLPQSLWWVGGRWVTKLYLTLTTPWTVACKAPLSMGFSRQEYWSGLPFLSPGNLPNPENEPGSPALQADSLPTELQGKFMDI